MRILVVTSTFPRWTGDTEPTFVFDLCKYLHGNGIEVDVLAPHAAGAKRFEILEGISVYRYKYFFSSLQNLAYSGGIMAKLKSNPINYLLIPFFVLFQTISFYKRLKSTEYRLIHAHWIIPQGFISVVVKFISGKNNLPVLCTSHGGDLYTLDNYFFRNIKKWTISKCTVFAVVSNAMQRNVIALGIPEDKIRIMPMGVDLQNVFKPVAGVKRNAETIIFVGRLVEKKGVTYLLDAMASVVKILPEVQLIVAGDGPLRIELEDKVRQLKLDKNVSFYGSIQHTNLPELYSSASIAVVPSVVANSGDQEGLGLVTIEALGCGCAVIVSSLEAIKDVIDADSGIFVTPGDASELAEKICYLVKNPEHRSDIAAKGRQRVLENFSSRISNQRYLKLIRNFQQE